MKRATKANKLVTYTLRYTGKASNEELRLTCLILSLCCITEANTYYLYMNELLDGLEIFKGRRKIKVFNSLGLNREEILKGLREINRRGFFQITDLTRTAYLFEIKPQKAYFKFL